DTDAVEPANGRIHDVPSEGALRLELAGGALGGRARGGGALAAEGIRAIAAQHERGRAPRRALWVRITARTEQMQLVGVPLQVESAIEGLHGAGRRQAR